MTKCDGKDAFNGHIDYHLWHGNDICIAYDASNTIFGSFSNFGYCYQLPTGIKSNSSNASSFLAGNNNQRLTTEIEFYEIKLDLKSVDFKE